jgi:hypothetical protein
MRQILARREASQTAPAPARYSLGGQLAPGRGKDDPSYDDRSNALRDKVWARARKVPRNRSDELRSTGERLSNAASRSIRKKIDAERASIEAYDAKQAAAAPKPKAKPAPVQASTRKPMYRPLGKLERGSNRRLSGVASATEARALKTLQREANRNAIPLSFKKQVTRGYTAEVFRGAEGAVTPKLVKRVTGSTGIQKEKVNNKNEYRVVSLTETHFGNSAGTGRDEKHATRMAKILDYMGRRAQRTTGGSDPMDAVTKNLVAGRQYRDLFAVSKRVDRREAKAKPAPQATPPPPAPAPARYSLGGQLAPGRGTAERSDLASNKRLYRKAMQSVKVTPDSFGTGAIVPFQRSETAPAQEKGRNSDQQITKASVRPNSSKESDFLKPVAEQRPGMASTRETITKVKAKERTRAENQSGVQTLKTGQLTADPDQFQYKMNTSGPVGVTNQFKETKVWNKELAGVIQVWKSPSNSKTFVVNGHHRYELAQRLGVSKLNVQYIQAQNPAEARMKGALTNIAEGRGTSVDAAKFFRDQPNVKDWSNELKSKGINLSERTASEGLALKDVHPKIWRDVVNEMTPLSRAVSIGKSGLQQEDQLNLYNRSTAGNWTSGKTSEFATELKNSARIKVKSGGLFGDDDEVSVFEHRAALSDRLKGRLSSDKNLFSKVARGRNASRIESVGANRIDKESSASRATEADNALMTFDRERKYSGRVNNELNNFGKRVAGGEKVDKVYNEFEKRITQTLRLINQGKFERRAARLKAITR